MKTGKLFIIVIIGSYTGVLRSARVPIYGSTGIGDVTPLAHLILSLFGNEMRPVKGETLPLIAQSSITTALSAFALHDLKILLDEFTALASLDVEAFVANPSPYHPMLAKFRRFSGYKNALDKINYCLQGSNLLHPGFKQRHLQSPLSFRCLAIVLGNAFDCLKYCERQVCTELNSHQQNPLILHESDIMLPCAHFDMQNISSAMDFARIALAPVLTTQVERSIKLLQASQTGLSDGLEPYNYNRGCGLSEFAFTIQALLAEARSLIAPVSAEICSSMAAEGIEDRMTMASLSARRLQKMVNLSFMIGSISAVISCQAIDLRGEGCILGQNTLKLKKCIRNIIPLMGQNDSPPSNLEKLTNRLKTGYLSKSIRMDECQNIITVEEHYNLKSNL